MPQIITYNIVITNNSMGDTSTTIYSWQSQKEAATIFVKYLRQLIADGKLENLEKSEIQELLNGGVVQLDDDTTVSFVKSSVDSLI